MNDLPVNVVWLDRARIPDAALQKIWPYFSARNAVKLGGDTFLLPDDYLDLNLFLGPMVGENGSKIYSLHPNEGGRFEYPIRRLARAHARVLLRLYGCTIPPGLEDHPPPRPG